MSQKQVPDSSFDRFDNDLRRGFTLIYSALRQLPDIAAQPRTAAVPDSLARSLMLTRVRCDEVITFATNQYWDAATDYTHFERIADTLTKRKDRKELLARARRQLELHRKNLRVLGVEVKEFKPGDLFDPGCCDPIEFKDTSEKDCDSTIAHCLRPAFCWTDEWGQPQMIQAEVAVYRFVSTVSDDLIAELAASRGNGNGRTCRSMSQCK